MNVELTQTLNDSVRASHAGTISFPEYIGRLSTLGVERYHTDYTRNEITYYLPDGDSHVVSVSHALEPLGTQFDASAVESAVRQSQRNEHTYADFVRKTMAAGCVGYFVQIQGARVLYFGRNGETHVERFPPAPLN